MNRHHADLIATSLHVALNLDVTGGEPKQEPAKCRGFGGFKRNGLGQQLVNGILAFITEPRFEIQPRAMVVQHTG